MKEKFNEPISYNIINITYISIRETYKNKDSNKYLESSYKHARNMLYFAIKYFRA